MYHQNFGKIETVTEGEHTSVNLTDGFIEFETYENKDKIELDKESLELASFLIRRADVPFLATEIKKEEPSIKGSISDKFRGIASGVSDTSLGEHFTSVGRGSAKWYGFMTETDIFAKLSMAEVGLAKIGMAKIDYRLSDREVARRERPFIAYKKMLLEGEREPYFTRSQKIAGVGAVAISLGVATVYVTRHFK